MPKMVSIFATLSAFVPVSFATFLPFLVIYTGSKLAASTYLPGFFFNSVNVIFISYPLNFAELKYTGKKTIFKDKRPIAMAIGLYCHFYI